MTRLFGCLLAALISTIAQAQLCDQSQRFCGFANNSPAGSSGGAPTHGSKVRINPSAVPLEKSLGLEAIFFDGADLAVVKGLGRVGAAISPSNSEQTFFGPPGIELPEDQLARYVDHHKYPAHKITLATAVGLYKNDSSGLDRFALNLGVMGKYNQITHALSPGGGLSGVLGPFTFGYSLYADQTQLDYTVYGLSTKPVTKYYVETYSAGLFLNSIAIDYSVLRMVTNDVATTSVLTGTLMLGRSLTTLAFRNEKSIRPEYNALLHVLESKETKNEGFVGFQYAVFDPLMVGIFYNYYLLHELSLGTTYFF